ncbi:MAG: dihydrolipoyl dehydrogenase [Verrucomicrobia bacterium]|nr:MAG: dihydrolipoyl dehydrogenase [Verrucomicrobiota bacterium]
MENFDVVVIGAGPGGYPAAIRAAQLGAKIAIVERELLGGTCLNFGCIPTKSLIAGADLLLQVRHAAQLGVKVSGVEADFAGMMTHKQAVVAQLRKGVQGLLSANGVKVFQGQASFEARDQIVVSQKEGELRIKAGKFIIATGSTSAVPGFLPKHSRVVESRSFLELTALPKRLIVMGGGYIGCELASLAAAAGSQVTIVELLDDVLMLLDGDVRREVRKSMETKLGIKIMTGKALENVKATDTGVSASVGGEKLEADVLLVAVGRKPVTDGLELERASLKTNERGYIPVDDSNRTAVATIYAIGDVNGGMQLAHAATAQAIIAAEAACGHKPRKNETLIPGVIFTIPEVALVGLTEAEAQKQGRAVKVGRFPFAALGRALAAGHPEGFVKLLADAQTDQLLGAQVVGAHATDLIAEATAAIRAELTSAELGRTVHAHPTFGEIWMEAAHALHGECIHAAPRKKT